MSSCKKYTLVQSPCPCLFKYDDGCGNIGSINLCDAKVVAFCGGFNIFSSSGGLKVSDESDFTAGDIENLICECKASNSGPTGDEDDPINVSLEGCMIQCGETPTKGVLPVSIECDSTTNITLACSTETGELVYVDTNQFPPVILNFDGTAFEGPISACENEYKWVETEYCSEEGITVRVVCWNVLDPAGTSETIWVLPDGTIVNVEPEGMEPCNEVCDPHVGQFIGDPKNTEPYNKININNPSKCCVATVTTSAGTFTVDGGSVFCLEWECNLDPEITITTDDPECLNDIKTTIQRTK